MLLSKLLLALSVCLVSYNVENLFTEQYGYYDKVDRIARVITSIGGDSTVSIIGLQEIENEKCVQDICRRLHYASYRYIHFDSQDPRGIDVALVYDSLQFRPYIARPYPVYLDSTTTTRDILYAAGTIPNGDTLHMMVCHLPSQLGGKVTSQWKRDKALRVIQQITDSILSTHAKAQIIAMGDMNDAPKENIPSLYNIMLSGQKKGQGSHKYEGIWTFLDQFYVSSALRERVHTQAYAPEWLLIEDKKYLGQKPRRHQISWYKRDAGGYSDHLPVICSFPASCQ